MSAEQYIAIFGIDVPATMGWVWLVMTFGAYFGVILYLIYKEWK